MHALVVFGSEGRHPTYKAERDMRKMINGTLSLAPLASHADSLQLGRVLAEVKNEGLDSTQCDTPWHRGSGHS